MTPIRTIVVPFDFSPAANAALEWAATFASATHARLVVLHVCERASGASEIETSVPGAAMEATVASAARRLEHKLEPVRRWCRASASVGVGDPSQDILACAAEVRADLIVMGTDGWQGSTDDRLGCVARDVLHHAGCAVLTLRAPPALSARRRRT